MISFSRFFSEKHSSPEQHAPEKGIWRPKV